ncbi:hypothetical protein Q5Y72_01440 [Paracoccus sp. 2205BS29-5]|uniref:Uncharacterized protein n=1 Tax=Paracoccus spongiarum TaxID=3064387 RepID=A0ABT9J7H8_9RHOB|nr:hypothetical protein [Paracoccus sp. 2205BS29-5]MDP5305763.1 hypothetical protein [Paracoccus sp. 2205BS29-5]
MRRQVQVQAQPVTAGAGMAGPQPLARRPVQRKGGQVDHRLLAHLVQRHAQIQHLRHRFGPDLVEDRPGTGAAGGIDEVEADLLRGGGFSDGRAIGDPGRACGAEHHEGLTVIGQQDGLVAGQRETGQRRGAAAQDRLGPGQFLGTWRRGTEARRPQQQVKRRQRDHHAGQQPRPQRPRGPLVGGELPPQFVDIGRALVREEQHEAQPDDGRDHQHDPARRQRRMGQHRAAVKGRAEGQQHRQPRQHRRRLTRLLALEQRHARAESHGQQGQRPGTQAAARQAQRQQDQQGAKGAAQQRRALDQREGQEGLGGLGGPGQRRQQRRAGHQKPGPEDHHRQQHRRQRLDRPKGRLGRGKGAGGAACAPAAAQQPPRLEGRKAR